MDTLSTTQLAWIAGISWGLAVAFCVGGIVRDRICRYRRTTNRREDQS